ncbi:MAG: hypothetical protein M1834_008799 [Cirrosporium novae-zelandiae]|nr:MAG: hypothetical protein M1834_008799 [Cirrosporium novae-zelandiae]
MDQNNSDMLALFRVRNLYDEETARKSGGWSGRPSSPSSHGCPKVMIPSNEYERTVSDHPEASLRYLDPDDGELVVAGSALELSQRLDESPLPPTRPKPHDSDPQQSLVEVPLHIFDIKRRSSVVDLWRNIERSNRDQAYPKERTSSLEVISGTISPQKISEEKVDRQLPIDQMSFVDAGANVLPDLNIGIDPADGIARRLEMGKELMDDRYRRFLSSDPPKVPPKKPKNTETLPSFESLYQHFKKTQNSKDAFQSATNTALTPEGRQFAQELGQKLRDQKFEQKQPMNVLANRWASYSSPQYFQIAKPEAPSQVSRESPQSTSSSTLFPKHTEQVSEANKRGGGEMTSDSGPTWGTENPEASHGSPQPPNILDELHVSGLPYQNLELSMKEEIALGPSLRKVPNWVRDRIASEKLEVKTSDGRMLFEGFATDILEFLSSLSIYNPSSEWPENMISLSGRLVLNSVEQRASFFNPMFEGSVQELVQLLNAIINVRKGVFAFPTVPLPENSTSILKDSGSPPKPSAPDQPLLDGFSSEIAKLHAEAKQAEAESKPPIIPPKAALKPATNPFSPMTTGNGPFLPADSTVRLSTPPQATKASLEEDCLTRPGWYERFRKPLTPEDILAANARGLVDDSAQALVICTDALVSELRDKFPAAHQRFLHAQEDAPQKVNDAIINLRDDFSDLGIKMHNFGDILLHASIRTGLAADNIRNANVEAINHMLEGVESLCKGLLASFEAAATHQHNVIPEPSSVVPVLSDTLKHGGTKKSTEPEEPLILLTESQPNGRTGLNSNITTEMSKPPKPPTPTTEELKGKYPANIFPNTSTSRQNRVTSGVDPCPPIPPNVHQLASKNQIRGPHREIQRGRKATHPKLKFGDAHDLSHRHSMGSLSLRRRSPYRLTDSVTKRSSLSLADDLDNPYSGLDAHFKRFPTIAQFEESTFRAQLESSKGPSVPPKTPLTIHQPKLTQPFPSMKPLSDLAPSALPEDNDSDSIQVTQKSSEAFHQAAQSTFHRPTTIQSDASSSSSSKVEVNNKSYPRSSGFPLFGPINTQRGQSRPFSSQSSLGWDRTTLLDRSASSANEANKLHPKPSVSFAPRVDVIGPASMPSRFQTTASEPLFYQPQDHSPSAPSLEDWYAPYRSITTQSNPKASFPPHRRDSTISTAKPTQPMISPTTAITGPPHLPHSKTITTTHPRVPATHSRTATFPSSPKTDNCISDLISLGYDKAKYGVGQRLSLYAAASNGDLGEAIDMIEEEVKAYGALMDDRN